MKLVAHHGYICSIHFIPLYAQKRSLYVILKNKSTNMLDCYPLRNLTVKLDWLLCCMMLVGQYGYICSILQISSHVMPSKGHFMWYQKCTREMTAIHHKSVRDSFPFNGNTRWKKGVTWTRNKPSVENQKRKMNRQILTESSKNVLLVMFKVRLKKGKWFWIFSTIQTVSLL